MGRHTRSMLAAVLLLAGCGSEKEPAQAALGNLEAIVMAASPDAARYAPDKLKDVEAGVGRLRSAFARGDYAAVLAAAPQAMTAAHALASSAAAAKAAEDQALQTQWTALAATVPDYLQAVHDRLMLLYRKPSKRPAVTADLGAAQGHYDAAVSLWSKSQAAFASGNMREAVGTAQRLKMDLEGQAVSLELAVPRPALRRDFPR